MTYGDSPGLPGTKLHRLYHLTNHPRYFFAPLALGSTRFLDRGTLSFCNILALLPPFDDGDLGLILLTRFVNLSLETQPSLSLT